MLVHDSAPLQRSAVTYSQNPDVLATSLPDDEVALLDTVTQKYYTLNETGAFIWNAFDAGSDLEVVAQKLEATYEVSADLAQASVQQVVDELVRDGLLVSARPD